MSDKTPTTTDQLLSMSNKEHIEMAKPLTTTYLGSDSSREALVRRVLLKHGFGEFTFEEAIKELDKSLSKLMPNA